ncbi:MAG: helix-turn-helix domain-containing protein [Pseudoclavibacter sp.]
MLNQQSVAQGTSTAPYWIYGTHRVSLRGHVGSNIRELRQKPGLSQDDLASETGIDSSNIRSYESSRALVGLLSLVRTPWP